MGEAAILVVLLPVQEPVWDLELQRVVDDHNKVLKLLCRKLASSAIESPPQEISGHFTSAEAAVAKEATKAKSCRGSTRRV